MTLPLSYSPKFSADIGEHVMPMRKFDLVAQAARDQGLPIDWREPSPIDDTSLLRVHTPKYVDAIRTGMPKSLAESQKFPWSTRLAESVRYTNGALLQAALVALQTRMAGALCSGFHHAHAGHGEGFCTFNGLVVAAESLRAANRVQRVLILDLDLHYGNGTVSLLRERPHLYNLSIYGSWYHNNATSDDVVSTHDEDTANCWSVAVPNATAGTGYLDLVQQHVPRAIERAQPDLILYQAGADPYREDPYSPLDVGVDDLRKRDHWVLSQCLEANIPVAWVLAGGYTKDVKKVVEVHVNTCRVACELLS